MGLTADEAPPLSDPSADRGEEVFAERSGSRRRPRVRRRALPRLASIEPADPAGLVATSFADGLKDLAVRYTLRD